MNILDRYRAFVFDLDGTVYLGDELLPGAQQLVTSIRRTGAPVLFLTNKPLETSSAYAAKLTRLGLPTTADEVVSSLDALVTYLGRTHPAAHILPISERLLATTLAQQGFSILDPRDADRAEVVAVSFDRTFDYGKLTAAFRAVTRGAAIVATNPDRFCPMPDGGHLPDCAAMLAAIEACTGAQAEAVVGKPSVHMAASILDRLALPAHEILMFGDRLETDILMASNAGMASALVLSGATDRSTAMQADPAPTYVLNGLADLANPTTSLRTP